MARKVDWRRIEIPDAAAIEAVRGKSPAQRLSMAADCNEMARLAIAAGVRAAHSTWSDEQVQAEVAKRMLNDAD